MILRARCEQAFGRALHACDPAARVRAALAARPFDRNVHGIAVGKAAQAMARGAGPVVRGVCISNYRDDEPLPAGWAFYPGAHPVPDERSLVAGDAVIDLVASAPARDQLLALVSGGASAMIERPAIPFARFVAEIAAVMASGADIRTINAARIERSLLKGGKLAAMAAGPIRTLIVSDVIGDPVEVIGSGPTVAPGGDVEVVAPMQLAVDALRAAVDALEGAGSTSTMYPLDRDIEATARSIVASPRWRFVAGGEPVIALPADRGTGGRAQHLALLLARGIRGDARSAFVAGSDGIDGPPVRGDRSPAGAYVDGTTWDRIIAAGIDPELAIARCDSTPALDAAGALVITGPTGINHGDLVIVG